MEEDLKDNWELYVDGYASNLPKILKRVEKIDLFHYDSNKSYSGRDLAISQVEKKMSRDGVIIFDDIQDNSYFHDYLKARDISSWHIFEYEGKYIGMIGKLTKR